jgi:hypothetical protein
MCRSGHGDTYIWEATGFVDCACQEVDKDLLTEDEQSAYWYQRYTLRMALDASGEILRDEAGEPVHDLPTFLEPVKETILTTGESLCARITPCEKG